MAACFQPSKLKYLVWSLAYFYSVPKRTLFKEPGACMGNIRMNLSANRRRFVVVRVMTGDDNVGGRE
jgi:hypothetical protein